MKQKTLIITVKSEKLYGLEKEVEKLDEQLREGWRVVSATPVLVAMQEGYTETRHIIYVLEKDGE